MPKGYKKVLTLDDLVSFCKSPAPITRFSSAESGFKLSVQTPATLEFESQDNGDNTEDDSMFYGLVKAFHTEGNRNGSYIPNDAAVKAMSTMKYRPILAYINNFGDDKNEDYDFTSHQIEIDAKGNFVYIESQVGCFTADPPYMQYDSDLERNFIYGKVAIPRNYTKAADIIEAKGGTKVSVELSINSMSWDADDNKLILEDFIVEGCTLLGRSMGEDGDYGAQVEEGMKGAKLILDDFREDNNSVVGRYSNTEAATDSNIKLIETLEMLNQTLSNFYIDKNIFSGKEECLMEHDNLNVVVETESVAINETNALNDLEQSVVDTTVTETTENVVMENNEEDDDITAEETEVDDTLVDDAVDEDEQQQQFKEGAVDEATITDGTGTIIAEDIATGSISVDSNVIVNENCFSITFQLSHDDIRCGLYNLIYETYPDEYLDIIEVFDDHFIMCDWLNGGFYKQDYTKDNDVIALSGERVVVYAEFITESEKNALDLMRNTYQSMQDELQSYKLNEAREQKITNVRDNDDYAVIKESAEFKELVDHMDEYSLEEFTNKADLILAKYAKATKAFSHNGNNENENNKSSRFVIFSTVNNEAEKASEPYGGIFKDILQRKNSNKKF